MVRSVAAQTQFGVSLINNRVQKGAEFEQGAVVTFPGDPSNNCIGSACMFWRWEISPLDAEAKLFAYPDAAKGVRPIGYCGLAGKP